MSFLNDIGTSEETFAEANGASVTAAFEPLPSGAYKATVKAVMIYEGRFGTQMKVIINATESDRDIEFRQDIGAKLKKDETTGKEADNIGYANRIKMVAYAAGVDVESLTLSPTVTKHRIYGKEVDVKLVQGLAGKSVLALVRLSNDPTKEEGESYKYSNDLEGVCAVNGLDASGENAKEIFEKKVEKSPIWTLKVKAKAGGAEAAAPTKEAAAAMSNLI